MHVWGINNKLALLLSFVTKERSHMLIILISQVTKLGFCAENGFLDAGAAARHT